MFKSCLMFSLPFKLSLVTVWSHYHAERSIRKRTKGPSKHSHFETVRFRKMLRVQYFVDRLQERTVNRSHSFWYNNTVKTNTKHFTHFSVRFHFILSHTLVTSHKVPDGRTEATTTRVKWAANDSLKLAA